MDSAQDSAGRPTHVVTRPFEGSGGVIYRTGDLVDAGAWSHTQRLVPRHLRPLAKVAEGTYDAVRFKSLEAEVRELRAIASHQALAIAELREELQGKPQQRARK